MKLLKSIAFFTLAFLFQDCAKPLSNNFEFYEKMNKVQLNKLKMKGIYYSYHPKECDKFSTGLEDYIEWFIFYENGYFLGYGTPGFIEPNFLGNAVEHTLQDVLKSDYRKMVALWGPYVIKGDSLFLQQLAFEERLIAVNAKKAKIVNDSTFEFTKGVCQENSALSKAFLFQRTKSKPDSINPFLTDKSLIRKIERLKKEKRN